MATLAQARGNWHREWSQPCFTFHTNTGEKWLPLSQGSSIRIKKVLFNNCLCLPKPLNSYKTPKMKFAMQQENQTVKWDNSSLPPAFCNQNLFCTWGIGRSNTHQFTVHSAHATLTLVQWAKRWKDLHRANVTYLWKTLQDMKSPWLQGLSDVHFSKKLEPARGSKENEKDKA